MSPFQCLFNLVQIPQNFNFLNMFSFHLVLLESKLFHRVRVTQWPSWFVRYLFSCLRHRMVSEWRHSCVKASATDVRQPPFLINTTIQCSIYEFFHEHNFLHFAVFNLKTTENMQFLDVAFLFKKLVKILSPTTNFGRYSLSLCLAMEWHLYHFSFETVVPFVAAPKAFHFWS